MILGKFYTYLRIPARSTKLDILKLFGNSIQKATISIAAGVTLGSFSSLLLLLFMQSLRKALESST